jgi:hypothetical protein
LQRGELGAGAGNREVAAQAVERTVNVVAA